MRQGAGGVKAKLRWGLIIIATMVLLAASADFVGLHDPIRQDYQAVLKGASADHPLGTDSLGRDVWSRLVYGARVSLGVSIAAVILMTLIGVALGVAAGWFGGVVDGFIMRIADVFLAFPFILGAIALMTVFGPGTINVFIALAILGWPQIARITRAQVMNEASQDYIAAVKAAGGSPFYILRRHLLPNAAGPVAVVSLMGVGSAILTEATLSFLGIGVQLPYPAWGSMLAEAVGLLTVAPWLIYGPGAMMILACLGFNLLGEGVRDALDLEL